LNDIVDFHLNAANLKRVGVSCHALRHTFGNLAVEGGAPLEQLRETMGHGQIETTELYVKAVARVKENPANFIDVDF
jgi:site-specific recombinase XerD